MLVCAWCTKTLDPGDPSRLSHGMCEECKTFFSSRAEPTRLADFIGQFDFPVLVLDPSGVAVEANERAQEFVHKSAFEILGQLKGDILECAHARLPQGCGRTIHCEACTIRSSVLETYRSGRPLADVDAYQDLETPEGTRRVPLKISTVRRGDCVLMKIVPASEAIPVSTAPAVDRNR